MLTSVDEQDIEKVTGFYLDPFTPLLRAMVQAEGGRAAFIRAVRCSFPEVDVFGVALARACKTVRRLASKFQKDGGMLTTTPVRGKDPWTDEDGPLTLVLSDEFIDFLAKVWAPVGVANDPGGLNLHWPVNVKTLYRQYALGDRGADVNA